MGGREVLIKAVLQAIPSYAMYCFKVPVSVYHDIEQSCASFWWRGTNDRGGMHWTCWESLCKPRGCGGLGFRNLIAFDKALLAKHVWRIIYASHSLKVCVLKARYFKYWDIRAVGLAQILHTVALFIVGS